VGLLAINVFCQASPRAQRQAQAARCLRL
jgi:hypothetical protein